MSAIRADFSQAGSGIGRRADSVGRIDAWLGEVWAGACEVTGVVSGAHGMALAAVGGHARRDSGPAGDLDLVIVHDGSASPHLAEFVEQVWYPIWDNGFRLDHAVRAVSTCRQVARSDIAAAVGMLELRPIVGDADLVLRARHVLREDWRRNARRRIPEIGSGIVGRLERHGDVANLLEPDLKHARGGLRDAAMIDALVATWLADSPHHDWQSSRARLLDVRDALHAVAGRCTERLILPEQDAVAAALGLVDADALLTEVSACGRVIGYALDQTHRAATRALMTRRGLRRLKAPRLRAIEPGIAVHDGEIVTIPGSRIAATRPDPLLALRATAAAARMGIPLSSVSAERLKEQMPLTQPTAAWPPAARNALIEVLGAGEALPALWETLDHCGHVQRWLPEWSGVRSRPQRNTVHKFTVDRHCVQTCVEVVGLGLEVGRPDLLLLACLLHDIGKLPGEHDHAATVAPVAERICRRIGFGKDDARIVRRLVAEHLTLIELATRRDPDDPVTIETLAAAVAGDRDTLDMLAMLTEADARAAGPAAWTSWRARLVNDLVDRARTVLDGRPAPGPSPLTPDESAMVGRVRATGEAAVAVSERDDVVAITVVAPDRTGLFADVAGILACGRINVRTALIRTVDGIAVDTWWSRPHGAVEPGILLAQVNRLAAGDVSVLAGLSRREAAYRPPAGVLHAPQVFLIPGASADASAFEVRALDRPGLLHGLGSVLREADVSIRSAHVATLAGRAVDVLYLAEATGGALPPSRVAEVIGLLGTAAGVGAT